MGISARLASGRRMLLRRNWVIVAQIDVAGAVATVVCRGLGRAGSRLSFTQFALAQREFLDLPG